MIKKVAERTLINSPFSQSAKAIPFFRTQFQVELNYYEMKLHIQTSSFSFDNS